MKQNTKKSTENKTKTRIITIVFTIVIILAVYFDYPPGIADIIFGEQYLPEDFGQNESLDVVFIDVGQGDSAIIGCMGNYVLIDAGENDQGNKVLRMLDKLGIKALDAMILTHPHSDHIGGADTVLNGIDVKKIYMTNYIHATKTYEDVLDAVKKEKLTISVPEVGGVLSLDGMDILFLHPDEDSQYEEINDYSIVCLIYNQYGRIMFAGDAEEASEEDVLKTNYILKADVLKVGHHGSKSSTSDNFLRSVNPGYAIISCGDKNEFGHPNSSTIDKLEDDNVAIYITYETGSVVMRLGETGIEIITQNE